MEAQLLNNSQLFRDLVSNNIFQKAIEQANRKYRIKHYKIEKLKPMGIWKLMKKKSKKGKFTSIDESNYTWGEGQLKVFIWFLVGYVFINKIDINDMNENDFHFFKEIFQEYSVEFLNYQAKFLLRSTQKVTWSQDETKLLKQIIKNKFHQKNWNTVAYQLYILSDKTVFRTPKQCRERWLNHEDPNKIHSEWGIEEDIELLRLVRTLGKKWSLISKSMKQTRTEHMVKNRFTSLINKTSKNQKQKPQREIIRQLLELRKSEKKQNSRNHIPISEFHNADFFPISKSLPIQPSDNIELQEVDDLMRKQKQIDCLFSYNLITDQTQQMEEEDYVQCINEEEVIDFFEVESQKSIEMFLNFN